MRPLLLPSLLVAGVLWLPPATAQPAPRAPAEPAEVAALDALLQELAQQDARAAYDPANLLALSRLLSSPCDQLAWLGRQLAAPELPADAARALAEAARQRGQQLGALLADCAADWSAWATLPEPAGPTAAHELTDAAALRDRLAQASDPAEYAALTPFQRFTLLARGCDPALMFPQRETPAWDVPRAVLERVAGAPQSPPFWDLRNLRQRLTDAYGTWSTGEAADFSEAGQDEAVTAAFQVSLALVDRALGLDANSARRGTALQYRDDAAAWSAVAAALDARDLWSWAALAHLLAACPENGTSASAATLDAARAPWGRFRVVNSGALRAVDAEGAGWLVRLVAGRLAEARGLPLARDFLATRRAARAQQEQAVRAALAGAAGGGDAAADRVFQAIQQAKAAELDAGAAVTPRSLGQLLQDLGNDEPWVYLFVEILELRSAGGAGAAPACGVAVYREKYVTRIGGQTYTDRYIAQVIPEKGHVSDVVAAALSLGPPANVTDARVMIALDGPPDARWLDFEKDSLLPRTGGTGGDPSWIVYVPSASVLTPGTWSLDETLRVWYRAALAAGEAPLLASALPPALSRTGRMLEKADLTLYSISLAAPGATDPQLARALNARALAALMDLKRASRLSVIPLWVSK
ncbi:MAG: hypothetical protein KA383_02880 [Phycisphaerae bacterium]|nr:hypothetical protein [Phycisphaerae bacterium]